MKKEIVIISKAIVATLLYVIGIELIGSWFLIAETIDFKNYYEYYTLIQGALQLIGILIFLYFVNNRTFKTLFEKTHRKWWILGIILGILFVFMQTPLNLVYNVVSGTEYNIAYRFDGFSKLNNINLISVFFLIPIGEELFFRGYIQNNLQQNTHTIIAILLASLMFASIHSPYMNLILESSKQDWNLFYLTFFGGQISGILYFKSKSIVPSILFHIFWNLMISIV
ncbi:type II CAAX endopeptidase family protein [Maribacter sp. HS]|uniref:CPBP family intramembrane glutamic endopeptidase n=1 Tax=Maribacter sp. HS TaxID=3110480 RepID=UPI003A8BE026